MAYDKSRGIINRLITTTNLVNIDTILHKYDHKYLIHFAYEGHLAGQSA
jgi:hypothetical protein